MCSNLGVWYFAGTGKALELFSAHKLDTLGVIVLVLAASVVLSSLWPKKVAAPLRRGTCVPESP